MLWAKFPRFAPVFIASIAARPRAPKLIAEMLSTELEYGWRQSGPPTVTRNAATGSDGTGCGATECIIHV